MILDSFINILIKLLFWAPVAFSLYFFGDIISVHGINYLSEGFYNRSSLSIFLLVTSFGLEYQFKNQEPDIIFKILGGSGSLGFFLNFIFSFIFYFSPRIWFYWMYLVIVYLYTVIPIIFILNIRNEFKN